MSTPLPLKKPKRYLFSRFHETSSGSWAHGLASANPEQPLKLLDLVAMMERHRKSREYVYVLSTVTPGDLGYRKYHSRLPLSTRDSAVLFRIVFVPFYLPNVGVQLSSKFYRRTSTLFLSWSCLSFTRVTVLKGRWTQTNKRFLPFTCSSVTLSSRPVPGSSHLKKQTITTKQHSLTLYPEVVQNSRSSPDIFLPQPPKRESQSWTWSLAK